MRPSRCRWMLAASLALVALATTAHAAKAAPCAIGIGWKVILASDAVDPDVFLWDSRARLIDYTAGRWSSTRAIFAHTLLAPSGTEAIVVACTAGAAHPKYTTSEQDVVGVRITRGQFKGRYGWVLASDAHPSPGSRRSPTGLLQ
ncbi:MAG: hypothetical protein JO060_07140 [Candidatus Eremiobacteraeota bacterium]|nr:hypothetical protein [Candidatus Eremiobacteraeota bacterium]